MISWWWLVPMFMVGFGFGVWLAAAAISAALANGFRR